MKKILIIVPYFGDFNNYFNLWLNSVKNNPSINFLIITDNKTKYNYPKNIKVIYRTFDFVKQIVKTRINENCKLENPYKLCDYRPFFNVIFEEYIKGYHFWGWCDTDLIFGNIRKLIY